MMFDSSEALWLHGDGQRMIMIEILMEGKIW